MVLILLKRMHQIADEMRKRTMNIYSQFVQLYPCSCAILLVVTTLGGKSMELGVFVCEIYLDRFLELSLATSK
jgi:hypothetical protein